MIHLDNAPAPVLDCLDGAGDENQKAVLVLVLVEVPVGPYVRAHVERHEAGNAHGHDERPGHVTFVDVGLW